MPSFSKKSRSRLQECDFKLQSILDEVIKRYDCTILQGHRDKKTQDKYYKSGKSKLKWPNSKHNSKPSKAVDVAPWPIPKDWGEHWKDRVKFYELKAIMFYEAEKQGYRLRYGGDWDMDNDYKDQTFDDLVHFELYEV
jgi:peptidoglycan L-alanyl-D-glutamate endopeptidase CwlK